MKALVDTNVFAYLFDDSDPTRRERARGALETRHELTISTQVLIELHAVLRRKFRYSHEETTKALSLLDYPTIPADRDLTLRAVSLASTHDLSIFDAMIVEAAASAGCDELWTEDLATGASLRGVRVVNPLA